MARPEARPLQSLSPPSAPASPSPRHCASQQHVPAQGLGPCSQTPGHCPMARPLLDAGRHGEKGQSSFRCRFGGRTRSPTAGSRRILTPFASGQQGGATLAGPLAVAGGWDQEGAGRALAAGEGVAIHPPHPDELTPRALPPQVCPFSSAPCPYRQPRTATGPLTSKRGVRAPTGRGSVTDPGRSPVSQVLHGEVLPEAGSPAWP